MNFLSFKNKLHLFMMLLCMMALMISTATFVVHDVNMAKQQYGQKLALFVQFVGENIQEKMNADKLDEIENALPDLTHITILKYVAFYDGKGQLIAGKTKTPEFTLNKTLAGQLEKSPDTFQKYHFESKYDQKLTLLVALDYSTIYSEYRKLAYLVGLAMFPILMLSFLISRKLVMSFAKPIDCLISSTVKIAESKDFTTRVENKRNDEFGVLIDNFNVMLEEIEQLETMHANEANNAKAYASKMKFLLEKTEVNKKRLEEEAIVRLKAEAKIRKIRNHLSDIIDSMPSMLICIDSEYHVTEWNKAVCHFTKVKEADAKGKALEEMFPIIAEKMSVIKDTVDSRKTHTIEKFEYIRNEQVIYFDILIYPLITEADMGAVIRLDDITTHVRMENMMVQTEKMMSVGGLAAGMAHEINNPLGGILQGVQNINRRLDENLPKNIEVAQTSNIDLSVMKQYLTERGIFKFLDGIKDSGERAALIVKNMLQFSRKSNHAKHSEDITKLLDRAISLAENDYDLKKSYDFRKITIERDYDANITMIPCLASELEQVILNLLRNAAQAMNEHQKEEQKISIKTYPFQQYLNIDIQDNGPGISETHLKKIFEPFFTTKEVGVGTGLGLSVSFFIIKNKHGGEMTATSIEGKGTTFTLSLPIEEIQAQTA